MNVNDQYEASIRRLCFGTVQLGMPYGMANRTGMPSDVDADALITEALANGVTMFDTAQAYGESEARLGRAQAKFAACEAQIVTKLAPIEREVGEGFSALEERVEGLIYGSMQRLCVKKLDYVMLHRVAHLQAYEGCVWSRLLELQAQGLIGCIGVSVATPDELRVVLEEDGVGCVQLPFNIVDSRISGAGLLPYFIQRRDVQVFARSAYLQGVLMQPVLAWPVLGEKASSGVVALLDEWVARFGRQSRADLCLAYVLAQQWIDYIVLGMENMMQLRHNITLFKQPPLSREACEEINQRMPVFDDMFLNPALWPKKGD